MKIRATGVARGSALIVTGAAALVLGVGGPAFAGGSDADSNGDVHSNCHTGAKLNGGGGEEQHGPNAEGEDCKPVTPTPTPTPTPPKPPAPVQPGAQAPAAPKAVTPAAPKVVTPVSPAKVAPIPTTVSAGQHTTDSWTVPLGTGLVTLGAAGSAAALVARRRTAQR